MAAETKKPPALRTPRQALNKKPGSRTGDLARKISSSSVLWLLVVVYGFPTLWFVMSSFKPAGELFSYPLTFFPSRFTLDGYAEAWTKFDFAGYFVNTLIVAVGATLLTVVASAAAGYALAKYQSWWLKIFAVCIIATTMLPGETILAPLFVVVRDLGLYNNLAGVIVPAVITATGTFMFRQFFVTVPNDLLEAARIDGSGEVSTFIRIMLPLAKPIIMTLAIFSFQWRWNDYLWPLIILNDPNEFTLQIGVASIIGAQNINWSVLLGASVMSMIPLVAIYLIFQKYVMSADMNAGLKD
ncbi:carbohydrate ABC transporter permease [Actinoplanes couchii]|uniref:Sugar ABC transporter permease n=1 Tax=Actinoplanes couchii TaxID=403638 RepID=A0ABQ3X250_9ACTN|nr:carbohydrate ABC transporter permease [Actinoplanes couchii]MDR6316986.1 alpha-1,4-digalacturonate transport system permease protein [Actinoplanes couchii]GID52594.1 sugar ABC transporter permease [Actinoplanes couchii]